MKKTIKTKLLAKPPPVGEPDSLQTEKSTYEFTHLILTHDDILKGPCVELQTTSTFQKIVIVTMETSAGKMDILFNEVGELVRPGEQDETVRKLESHFNKSFDRIKFNDTACFGKIIEPFIPESIPVLNTIHTSKAACLIDETENWDKEINDLEMFFAKTTLPETPLKINHHCTVIDLSKFIESHLATVKANNGKQRFLPFLYRLQGVRNIIAR